MVYLSPVNDSPSGPTPSNETKIPWWAHEAAFALYGGVSGACAGGWAFFWADDEITTTAGFIKAYPFIGSLIVIAVSVDRIVRGLSDDGEQKRAYERLRSSVPLAMAGFAGAFALVALLDAASGLKLEWLVVLGVVAPLVALAVAVNKLSSRLQAQAPTADSLDAEPHVSG
ncbi:hypothetical protein I601_2237 [Nocardioides dokdonensis FR1436]|uniref:Uncharacterized protein n=1 Tax=Nocardioides dokdonensis FR1436 TaxID=1300347 RepID=A0A1A9GLW9_9ACTN|nr:hypothetical protein [Nocardioides dokdonensis]ANH38662.1 hypothetical protein I601_2237 [Nocardioides dokdonensis FR1436]